MCAEMLSIRCRPSFQPSLVLRPHDISCFTQMRIFVPRCIFRERPFHARSRLNGIEAPESKLAQHTGSISASKPEEVAYAGLFCGNDFEQQDYPGSVALIQVTCTELPNKHDSLRSLLTACGVMVYLACSMIIASTSPHACMLCAVLLILVSSFYT